MYPISRVVVGATNVPYADLQEGDPIQARSKKLLQRCEICHKCNQFSSVQLRLFEMQPTCETCFQLLFDQASEKGEQPETYVDALVLGRPPSAGDALVQIQCVNHSKGCSSLFPLQQATQLEQQHMLVCQFAEVKCPHCGATHLGAAALKAHELRCERNVVSCPNSCHLTDYPPGHRLFTRTGTQVLADATHSALNDASVCAIRASDLTFHLASECFRRSYACGLCHTDGREEFRWHMLSARHIKAVSDLIRVSTSQAKEIESFRKQLPHHMLTDDHESSTPTVATPTRPRSNSHSSSSSSAASSSTSGNKRPRSMPEESSSHNELNPTPPSTIATSAVTGIPHASKKPRHSMSSFELRSNLSGDDDELDERKESDSAAGDHLYNTESGDSKSQFFFTIRVNDQPHFFNLNVFQIQGEAWYGISELIKQFKNQGLYLSGNAQHRAQARTFFVEIRKRAALASLTATDGHDMMHALMIQQPSLQSRRQSYTKQTRGVSKTSCVNADGLRMLLELMALKESGDRALRLKEVSTLFIDRVVNRRVSSSSTSNRSALESSHASIASTSSALTASPSRANSPLADSSLSCDLNRSPSACAHSIPTLTLAAAAAAASAPFHIHDDEKADCKMEPVTDDSDNDIMDDDDD